MSSAPRTRGDVRVGRDEGPEVEALVPGLEAVALDDLVGLLAGQALPGQGQEDALGEDEAAGRADVGLHPVRDGRPSSPMMSASSASRKSVRMNESGKMTRSAEEWEMSRSCQRATFSRPTWALARTRRARPGDPLAADGVLLVGHRRGALLALGERLFELEDLGPLEVADLDGELLDRGGEEGQGREDLGVAVALEDLGRDLGRPEPELLQGHRPRPAGRGGCRSRPSPRSGRRRSSRRARLEPADVAPDLLVPDEELEAEGHGLGVDAVGPADADGLPVLEGLASSGAARKARRSPRTISSDSLMSRDRAVSTTS